MKYSTVQIRPRGISRKNRKDWYVSLYSDGIDRVRGKTLPASIGFYHFPQFRGFTWGFNKLKQKMIKDREEEIKILLKDIEIIKNLTEKDTL